MTGKAFLAVILLTLGIDALGFGLVVPIVAALVLAGALQAGGPPWGGTPFLIGAMTYGLAAATLARSGAGLR